MIGKERPTRQEMVDDMLLHTPLQILNEAIVTYQPQIISSHAKRRQIEKYGYEGEMYWAVDADAAMKLYVDPIDTDEARDMRFALNAAKQSASITLKMKLARNRKSIQRYSDLVRRHNELIKGFGRLERRWRHLQRKHYGKTYRKARAR
jgi:hypothetical protein